MILKRIDGALHEPFEELVIDLPEEMSSKAIGLITRRKGNLVSVEPRSNRAILKFEIPSRGIIGLRGQMLTQTQGEAIMTHRFMEYRLHAGEIPGRINGSLISMEQGTAIPYSINDLQDRGTFFVAPNEDIYEGQVVGENSRPGDLVVNLTKTKKLTNVRAAGSDDKMKLIPPVKFTLEEALEYIQDDEYVEVTPQSIRIRKILLKEHERRRAKKTVSSEG